MSSDLGSSSSLTSLPTNCDDSIPLYYLNDTDKENIACHLDIESAWKFVAESIKMEYVQINWISNRMTSKGSETLLFLKDLQDNKTTLKDFMKAVNNSKYKVFPVIEYLNKRYPEIEKKYLEEKKMARCWPDSKPLNYSKSHFSKLETIPFQQCKRKTHVLLAHHNKDKKWMLNLANCLLKNGFAVSIEHQEELMRNSLIMKDQNLPRIYKIFQSADYVMILVSPSFLEDMKDVLNLTADDSNPNIGCQYVTSMVMETLNSRSTGVKKLVAVLVDGVRAEQVPKWMKQMKIYHWPTDYKDLLYFTMDPSRVIAKFIEERGRNGISSGKENNQHCRHHGCAMTQCFLHRK